MTYDKNIVDFLDIRIFKRGDTLHTTLYSKPTDKNSILCASSCHSPNLKKALPTSQFKRVARNNLTEELRDLQMTEMENKFCRRRYHKKALKDISEVAIEMTQRELLYGLKSKQMKEKLTFTTTYTKGKEGIAGTLKKNWNLLTTDRDLPFKKMQPPRIGYCRAASLKDYLIETDPRECNSKDTWLKTKPGCFGCLGCTTCGGLTTGCDSAWLMLETLARIEQAVLRNSLFLGRIYDTMHAQLLVEHLTLRCMMRINKYLRKAHFTTASHEDISFTDYGDVPGHYDIINWIQSDIPGKLDPNKVGSFNSLAPVGKQLNVNDSAIVWSPKSKTIPKSVCNEICAHGYRKVPWKEYPVCCYGCVPCAEGEISNTTDAETCIKCPEDRWPNDKRTLCIRKTVEFLSFEDTLGIFLTSVSIFSSIVTITVLGIFIRHHTTPVVKANNQNLSYTLLLSLMLSFLCSLLFIGRPVQVSCLLRQAAFGIIFTVSVSSVLAKSVTVAIAFNATKPDSKIKKWVGSRVSIHLVLVCSLGQTMICTLWLALYPPYPDYDTHSYIEKIILECNEGSVTAFYLVIGYIGFLSIVSFIVAFLVRKLPASFNEAQMITFSMLVFCSVWISFIPAYLSTKGKFIVAVEIFAILASSAGLLGCIFIPKCYIILFKSEFNTRVHMLSTH
ncbi:vomeronasal type-2 receptor 26-like [Bombina bombina]|uniref:vomeronasal type-2 receptor 26-like n=1 Tax=Bombina bombina TaxID=8345 RepID=UPI00235A4753|nr:vomeronasal type-2 receptor 26-like [Bombina bombina]